MSRSAAWNPQYHQIVLATDPIAYWLQDEKQGGVSYDWVRRSQGSDQDGAYTGVTLGQPGIGDGRTSPFFDGANDFNNIYTATFRDRFALTNHGAPGAVSEGTVIIWARVANVGVWTDGASPFLVQLRVDGNNRVYMWKSANNTLTLAHHAGGASEIFNLGGLTTTNWMCIALTWSASAGITGESCAYLDGIQVGATQVNLGVWAGVLAATTTVIGALSTIPIQVWHGYLAHGAVWGRACPPAEILHLYNEAFR